MNYKLFLCAGLLLTTTAFAKLEIDKKDKIDGVNLISGKDSSNRTYQGIVEKTFYQPLEGVQAGILNFDTKCNNKYKDKRVYTDKKRDCKYHNENIVESFVVRNIKTTGWTKLNGEVDRFVIGRKIYNRGEFGYYELITVVEGKDTHNKKTVTITQKMLTDKEAKIYVNPKFSKDSAFNHSTSQFVLTELETNKTHLTYEYKAHTDHWVLNKEVSVPQVFASISKSINDLVHSIDKESVIQSRNIAAQ